jgi:hypothetical protein
MFSIIEISEQIAKKICANPLNPSNPRAIH